MAIKTSESPEIPENEPFNLFVFYNRETQREEWIDNAMNTRFTMPMIELLDPYPVGDLFHIPNVPMEVTFRYLET